MLERKKIVNNFLDFSARSEMYKLKLVRLSHSLEMSLPVSKTVDRRDEIKSS